jgi:RNA polymerase sigma-70 factor (ECF subfamily)
MTNTEEFEAFMKAYQNMVYSTALRLLASSAEAEDVAQEVFLRAYDRFDSIKDHPTVGGWLRTVARNLSLNHLTRYRSRWRLFTDMRAPDSDRAPYQDEIEAKDRTDTGAVEKDQGGLMESFLSELPVKQRVPLVLYHFDEMSYEEIAKALKISLGKVKTDIRRGRESLREKLTRSKAAREEWGLLVPAVNS